jgi:MFS transporter, ACS family, allantoate permease
MAKRRDKSEMDIKSAVDEPAQAALDLVLKAEIEHVDPKQLRALLWKIDLRLLPLLCITYALQSIDKTTLEFLGYIAWEFPTIMILQRLPINYFISITVIQLMILIFLSVCHLLTLQVIIWGVVLMCRASVANFSALAAARTFLGVFEASINPGTMLLFSMYVRQVWCSIFYKLTKGLIRYYSREEQPLRMGIWIGSAGLGYMISGVASFGIGHIQISLDSWRWIFIIWGAITTVWGTFLFISYPGRRLMHGF